MEGKFPVILERTPYGKDNDVYYANHWVEKGYVVILQDVRGRFNSEGTWQFFRDDINDGYDTTQWIGSQPWSNCAIGTVGASYPGGTRRALALSNALCLKAMIPGYATSDAGRVGLRHNGAFELRWMNWIFNLFEPEGDRDGARNKEVIAKLGEQVREYVKGLPPSLPPPLLRLLPGGTNQFPGGFNSRCGPSPFHGAPDYATYRVSTSLLESGKKVPLFTTTSSTACSRALFASVLLTNP